MVKEQEKTCKFSFKSVMEVKELNGDLIVKGYIATTHKDSGNDIITKEALEFWAKEINDNNPRVNKVSVNHKRIDHVAGKGIPGTARVEELPDGQYGLYVETKVDKTRDDYQELKYRIEEGFLDSFSIEYLSLEGKKESMDEVRHLDHSTILMGWTLASQPMNENAVMVKELFNKDVEVTASYSMDSTTSHSSSSEQKSEETKMAEETKLSLEALQAEIKELQSKMTEPEKTAEEEEENPKKGKKPAPEEPSPEEEKESQRVALEQKETKETLVELKEFVNSIKESKETKMNTETKEQNELIPEYKEYVQAVESKESKGILAHAVGKVLEAKEIKSVGDFVSALQAKTTTDADYAGKFAIGKKENKYTLEYKGLSIGDNANSAYINATSNIGLSQAELQDIVMPTIFNALNESTVTFDLLAKDSMAGKGTNRVTFVLKTANTGAYFSTSNAITQTQTAREKYTLEFKKIYIGGAVDGDLVAASRGSPVGEALALEVADRTIALKKKMNQALFDETAGNAADATPLGIPALTDSAGNTTLYNTTRSAANKLAPDAAGDTYADGSGGLTEALLRNAIEQATTDGSQLSDLIFVGTPAVINKYKALFDGRQRTVPYSDRVGYQNAPDYEGVPLFSDVDSKASSLFLIDTSALRVAIFVPPTVEALGKRSDSDEFFVKSYYAVYSTAPRRSVEIYSIA